jgi:hypothetical protein
MKLQQAMDTMMIAGFYELACEDATGSVRTPVMRGKYRIVGQHPAPGMSLSHWPDGGT